MRPLERSTFKDDWRRPEIDIAKAGLARVADCCPDLPVVTVHRCGVPGACADLDHRRVEAEVADIDPSTNRIVEEAIRARIQDGGPLDPQTVTGGGGTGAVTSGMEMGHRAATSGPTATILRHGHLQLGGFRAA